MRIITNFKTYTQLVSVLKKLEEYEWFNVDFDININEIDKIYLRLLNWDITYWSQKENYEYDNYTLIHADQYLNPVKIGDYVEVTAHWPSEWSKWIVTNITSETVTVMFNNWSIWYKDSFHIDYIKVLKKDIKVWDRVQITQDCKYKDMYWIVTSRADDIVNVDMWYVWKQYFDIRFLKKYKSEVSDNNNLNTNNKTMNTIEEEVTTAIDEAYFAKAKNIKEISSTDYKIKILIDMLSNAWKDINNKLYKLELLREDLNRSYGNKNSKEVKQQLLDIFKSMQYLKEYKNKTVFDIWYICEDTKEFDAEEYFNN